MLGIGVFFALYFATDNAKIEAIMHSLNSMAGIRKYRIHDELPITLSSEETLLEAVSARAEESQKLKEKRSLLSFFVRVRAISLRVVSYVFR